MLIIILDQGAVSIRKTVLPGMAIPMLKIRRPIGLLSLTWKSPYVDKTVFILRRGPRGLLHMVISLWFWTMRYFSLRLLPSLLECSGGRFKKTYELLNLRALKISPVNKIHIFQCMSKIFCVEFQRYPLKFHTKYLTHTLKDTIFIQHWNFKSS